MAKDLLAGVNEVFKKTNVLDSDSEAFDQQLLARMDALCPYVYLRSAVGRRSGQDAVGLQRHDRHPVVPQAHRGDLVGLVVEPLHLAESIHQEVRPALGADDGVPGGGRFRIDPHGQGFDVDSDELGGIDRFREGVGHDDRDRLPDVANDFVGEHRPFAMRVDGEAGRRQAEAARPPYSRPT